MKKPKIKSLRDFDFKDKNVFMRVDFNVPLEGGEIKDSRRIDKAMPSISFVLEKGGRLVLASHLGRPKGRRDPKLSLKPAAEYLSRIYNLEVLFMEEPDSEAPKNLLPGLKSPQLILLENLRFHPGEEGRDRDFARGFAGYTDIYINEGFGISHRAHSSVSLLPEELPDKGLGFQFEEEMEKLDRLLNPDASKPFIVALGGSKLKDKIPLMESLIDQADEFLVGGLMAYTFLKALGRPQGAAAAEEDFLPAASIFAKRLKAKGKKLFLPLDHVVEYKGKIKVYDEGELPAGAVGKDIGPKTVQLFQERIQKAGSLFWNGPMGFFEKEAFRAGTQSFAKALAEQKRAYRVAGGGHSAMAAREFEKDIDHISTGGGAGLAYLQGKLLPGLKSLMTEPGL